MRLTVSGAGGPAGYGSRRTVERPPEGSARERAQAGTGGQGAGLHPVRRRRQAGEPVVPARAAGDRLFLPGGDDPRLHHRGVRFPRQPEFSGRGRRHGARRLSRELGVRAESSASEKSSAPERTWWFRGRSPMAGGERFRVVTVWVRIPPAPLPTIRPACACSPVGAVRAGEPPLAYSLGAARRQPRSLAMVLRHVRAYVDGGRV